MNTRAPESHGIVEYKETVKALVAVFTPPVLALMLMLCL